MDPHRVLLAGVSAALEGTLRDALPDVVFGRLPAEGSVRGALEGAAGAAAVVELDGDLEPTFRLIRALERASVRVIAVGPTKDADVILRAMRAGAKEFVLADDAHGLARSVREHVRGRDGDGAGAVYSVFAAKGGVGATTIAVNLAGLLQRRGLRTCLVDLDLEGDVLAYLDLDGGYSLADVIANMRRLDRDLLDATLPRHGSGVHVVSQRPRGEDAEAVAPPLVAGLLQYLRGHYDAVVVDGLRSVDDVAIPAVQASDLVLLVLTPEVLAVRDACRSASLLRRLGHASRLRVVLNRWQRHAEITPDLVAETVGLPVAANVANDYLAVTRAVKRGALLVDAAASSPVTRDVDAMVVALGMSPQGEAPQARRSILGRLFTR